MFLSKNHLRTIKFFVDLIPAATEWCRNSAQAEITETKSLRLSKIETKQIQNVLQIPFGTSVGGIGHEFMSCEVQKQRP